MQELAQLQMQRKGKCATNATQTRAGARIGEGGEGGGVDAHVACECDALALAARQADALLCNDCTVTQRHDSEIHGEGAGAQHLQQKGEFAAAAVVCSSGGCLQQQRAFVCAKWALMGGG